MTSRVEARAAQAARAAARVEPFVRLNAEVDRAIDAGLRVPCIGRGEWTSEDPGVRVVAGEACGWCPMVWPCLAAGIATRATWGVYGGVDLGDPRARRAAHRRAAA